MNMLTQEFAAAFTHLGRGMQIAGEAMERLVQLLDGSADETSVADEGSQAPAELPNVAGSPNQESKAGIPLIGGYDFRPRDPSVFVSAEYRRLYRAGTPRLAYVGRCPGLRTMSDVLGVPQNKVSTCKPDRLEKRLAALGREAYGSVYLADGLPTREGGFQKWSAYRPPASLNFSAGSPVSIAGASLCTVMPASLSWRAFDRRFDELVQLGCLEGPYASRFTARTRGSVSDNERAKEIVVFRGAPDFERLVAICETVVLEHLRL